MTVLSKEDLIEIRTLLSLNKTPQEIFEFRVANALRGERDWKRRTIYDACKKIQAQQGSVERRHGSGRPRTVRTEENVDRVERLLQSPPRKSRPRALYRAVGRNKRTQRYLEEHAPFIPASQWPAYSPDLNPCDYRLWAWMKQKLYERGTALNLDELKARIREVWDELDVRTIRKLRPRLQKVIDDGGKPIQQYFNKV
uniref:Transposase n=1 Tax=Acrobeloides nanus TaxID=290746 RepID=A0A914DWK6_9BILA